jgi:hypothetical protein
MILAGEVGAKWSREKRIFHREGAKKRKEEIELNFTSRFFASSRWK